MIPVILESPCRRTRDYTEDQARRYLRECIWDCLLRGESPYASHQMLTTVLNDDVDDQRAKGIDAGYAWWGGAEYVVMYEDLGRSEGMQAALDHARLVGKQVFYRSIR